MAERSPLISSPDSYSQYSTPIDTSQTNPPPKHTSSSKFLKRKPNHSKLLGSPSSKKSRESSINHRLQQSQSSGAISELASSRFVTQKKTVKEREVGEALLETAKSENNLFLRKKELEMTINKVYQDASKISKDSFFSKPSQLIKPKEPEGVPIEDYNHFGTHRNSKKSRTQFFNPDQLGLSSEISGLGKDEEEGSTQTQGQLLEECQLLRKKNKWLQQQLEGYAQRQYLLLTTNKHLDSQLREKERQISALQQNDSLKGDKDTLKWKEEVNLLAMRLAREEQRYNNLKEENDYMQTQLIAKNQELITLYSQHAEQDHKHRKQRQIMSQRLEKMRLSAEKMGQKIREEGGDKWRQRIFKQQQEIKYLQIQNQCLLICKDELAKTENESRKLREERDYFKQKVMEHIKRTKRMQEASRSENSSFVLELSETSIDHK